MTARSVAPILAAALLALLAGACGRPAGGPADLLGSAPPAADSVTVGLWRLDESGGSWCLDAGPHRLQATAGLDARTGFGRFGNAREFTSSIESWLLVPHAGALDTPRLTVEAWIQPRAYGLFEDTPIAGRWNEGPSEQSWLFAMVGLQRESRLTNVQAPGFHERWVFGSTPGRLMFLYQPADASPPQAFFSVSEVPLDRWTHVAASLDGQVVRLFLNGHLDAQFAIRSTIRPSMAPLLVGNYFDTRRLSSFSGDLGTGGNIGHPPVYAFQGTIDELRISSEARTGF